MTETPAGKFHAAFIAQLKELRESAGQPSYSEMNLLSRALDVPKELPASTLSDILNCKRERLPDWKLVASFVMVCHRHAAQTGLPVDRLGTLEQWQSRWAAARSEQPGPQVTGSFDLYRTPADEAERRTSRTVAYLVRRAAEGGSEPAFRLAIVHALAGEVAASRYWAHIAVRRRHPGAESFAGDQPPLTLAADLAFGYGQAYERESTTKHDIARFYYKLAADHGHPGAAERLRALRSVPFGKLLPAPVRPQPLPETGP
ncbi:hypothetical protein OUY22_13280 [Nonomuraea sp. MCN248]|uniref:XRE family transcriptional regulator n=1 Tax=Nonomuraea corallina TaxID=2989783 RepID=A0ABT4SB69_9ACTN|nr:hypothetical protein [Nonomuraea corallina]MDA0634390.1 hypothetical protein [Nonomuraea corallina]